MKTQFGAYAGWGADDSYLGYIRLKPGVFPEQINQKIPALLPKYIDVERERKQGFDMELYIKPVSEIYTQSTEVKRMVVIMSVLAFALLFVAAMNYILNSVSSLPIRARSVGVHKCNGASCKDIFNMFLFETAALFVVLESIVPDACPDILRICDTEGVVCLRDKVLQDGRVELSGSVRAALLYLPDGEEGIRRMEVELPFSCTLEHPALTPLCRVVALPRVQGADARLINPRKVLVRVDLAFCVQVYAPVEDDICSGVLAPEEAGVQQMSEQCDACTTVCVQEKPFTFSDEISLSGSKPEAEELLKCRAALRCSESKVIGNKLIFKGESQLQMLYRSSAGGLCTAEYELPFSQIMEITGAGEESTCDVYVVLTGLDCALDSGDGRTISVSMGLLAQAVVREERTLQMLTDVYSTAFQLTAESRTYTLGRLVEHGEKELTVREILETGMLAQEVSDAYVTIGAITQSRDGRRVTLTAEANVTVLYVGF